MDPNRHLVLGVGAAPQIEEIVSVNGDGLECAAVYVHVSVPRRGAGFQAQHQVYFASYCVVADRAFGSRKHLSLAVHQSPGAHQRVVIQLQRSCHKIVMSRSIGLVASVGQGRPAARTEVGFWRQIDRG